MVKPSLEFLIKVATIYARLFEIKAERESRESLSNIRADFSEIIEEYLNRIGWDLKLVSDEKGGLQLIFTDQADPAKKVIINGE